MHPCIHDATTLDGLAELRRSDPHSWHRLLRASARPARPSDTVAEALRRGGASACLPTDSSPAAANRLKKPRHCARRLLCCYGDVSVGEIDDRWLTRERRRQAVEGHLSCSPALIGACFTLLRQVAASANGRERRVSPRLRPRRRAALPRRCGTSSRARRTIGIDAVDAVLKAILVGLPLWLGAALHVQRHVGVSPIRVLALRVRDVNLAHRTVAFPASNGGPPLVYPMPAAAWKWLCGRVAEVAGAGPDARLFPQRRRPKLARRSVQRTLSRICERRSLPRLSMALLRRRAQAELLAADACRAQLRGRSSPALAPAALAAAVVRIRTAAEQGHPGPIEPVPCRAPQRCPPGRSERTWGDGARPPGRTPTGR